MYVCVCVYMCVSILFAYVLLVGFVCVLHSKKRTVLYIFFCTCVSVFVCNVDYNVDYNVLTTLPFAVRSVCVCVCVCVCAFFSFACVCVCV